jgi:heterodisulfide reductase subunit B
MKYSFYPGCSMEGAAVPYRISFEAVAEALGMDIVEIPDWNCCGATVASGVIGDFAAQVMAARNLALAEPKGRDVIVPCSSCYMNLALVSKRFNDDPGFRERANEVLGTEWLRYNGTLKIRQIVDVLVNDIGLDRLSSMVKNPLKGLTVAGYVGCQTPRVLPWTFDDPEHPVFMDRIIEALGATAVKFPMKTRCCGSSHSLTRPEITAEAGYNIIKSALGGGAQLIVTACPMCQMNLDAYQGKVRQHRQVDVSMPVLFLTQLMAVAFNLSPSTRALKYNIVNPFAELAPFGVKP